MHNKEPAVINDQLRKSEEVGKKQAYGFARN
jgi:hypothetical protein